jgi:carbamoyl-phosphate synthase large subunit
VGVKAPQFSFMRLEGADPTLGVEMASTGEVGCLGSDFDEAFLKALISVGFKFPIRSVLLSSGSIESKAELLESVRMLMKLGVKFYATRGTAKFLQNNGIPAQILNWPLEKRNPNTLDFIKNGKIDLVINIPKNYQETELTNDYMIRRTAVDFNVPLITNRQFAMRFAEVTSRISLDDLKVRSWAEYV